MVKSKIRDLVYEGVPITVECANLVVSKSGCSLSATKLGLLDNVGSTDESTVSDPALQFRQEEVKTSQTKRRSLCKTLKINFARQQGVEKLAWKTLLILICNSISIQQKS